MSEGEFLQLSQKCSLCALGSLCEEPSLKEKILDISAYFIIFYGTQCPQCVYNNKPFLLGGLILEKIRGPFLSRPRNAIFHSSVSKNGDFAGFKCFHGFRETGPSRQKINDTCKHSGSLRWLLCVFSVSLDEYYEKEKY